MSSLSTMQSNVASELGLNTTDDGSKITKHLNDAVIDVLLRTRCYVTTTTINEVSGTADYTLATSILIANKAYVTSSGTDFPMQPLSIDELIDLRLNSVSAAPARYYAVQGTLLSVYPTPNSADVITLYSTPRPTALSGASDDPSSTTYGGIPSEFHVGLELYAQWKMGSQSDDQSSAQGARYKQDYEEFLRRMKRQLAHKLGAKLPRARVGGRSSIFVNHDNSRYP